MWNFKVNSDQYWKKEILRCKLIFDLKQQSACFLQQNASFTLFTSAHSLSLGLVIFSKHLQPYLLILSHEGEAMLVCKELWLWHVKYLLDLTLSDQVQSHVQVHMLGHLCCLSVMQMKAEWRVTEVNSSRVSDDNINIKLENNKTRPWPRLWCSCRTGVVD